MGSPDRPLEDCPETFDGVHMGIAPRVFLLPVVDHTMVVADLAEDAIRVPFVGADARSGLDALEDRRNEGLAGSVGDNLGKHLAPAFQDAHDHCLVRSASGNTHLPSALHATADISLVHFDMASQRRIAIHLRHVLADFMAHAPRRFVGDGKLALQFLGRDAMPRRGEQVDRVVPLLQSGMRLGERRADHRINLVAAPRALVSRMALDAVKLPVLAALRAIKRLAEAGAEQVFQARIVVRETLEKVLHIHGLSHGRILHS